MRWLLFMTAIVPKTLLLWQLYVAMIETYFYEWHELLISQKYILTFYSAHSFCQNRSNAACHRLRNMCRKNPRYMSKHVQTGQVIIVSLFFHPYFFILGEKKTQFASFLFCLFFLNILHNKRKQRALCPQIGSEYCSSLSEWCVWPALDSEQG